MFLLSNLKPILFRLEHSKPVKERLIARRVSRMADLEAHKRVSAMKATLYRRRYGSKPSWVASAPVIHFAAKPRALSFGILTGCDCGVFDRFA